MSARAQPAAAQLQADIGQPDPGSPSAWPLICSSMRCAAISKRLQPAASCRCSALETNGRRLSQTGGRAWLKARSSGTPWPYCWEMLANRRSSRANAQRITGASTLAAQALEHVQRMGGLPVERRVDEAEDVVAGAVGDGGLHGIGADLAGVGQQFQLLDFLGGGEQIAFDSRRSARRLPGQRTGRPGPIAGGSIAVAARHPPARSAGTARPCLRSAPWPTWSSAYCRRAWAG